MSARCFLESVFFDLEFSCSCFFGSTHLTSDGLPGDSLPITLTLAKEDQQTMECAGGCTTISWQTLVRRSKCGEATLLGDTSSGW